MVVGFGADHAGFGLKERLKDHIAGLGHDVIDLGTHDPDEKVDYPLFAEQVAVRVTEGVLDLGILVCGTGIGMCIAANKVPGVRAAVVHDVTTARLAREHNNANVLALGGRLLAPELAVEIVDAFLSASFEARHSARLALISEMERKYR